MGMKGRGRMAKRQRAVLVTTDKDRRGVFYGFSSASIGDDIVVLTRARNVVYWSRDCRGVFGLAANGPSNGCKIGPEVSRIEINGVTSIADCTRAAVKAFDRAPWKG